MLYGYAAYRQAGAASGFGGDRPYRRDTDAGEGTGDVCAQRARALKDGSDSVGAGQQKPIKRAQVAKRFIERRKICGRMKSDHGLEDGLRAASFECAHEGFGLIGCTRDQNAAAS